ncbi:MAG: hypothetical protein K2Q22_11555, partial [Cytophagales bacterium]|nr:hypothetical protein [Cytophagales bacterium]
MKKIYTTLVCICMVYAPSLFAQTIPLLTIKEIQSVSGTNLANCNDSSRYTGRLVYVQGVVVTAPTITSGTITGINAPGSMACSGAFYIQDGTGPFSGILVRQSLTTKNVSTGILGLSVGDLITIRGTVREYANTILTGHNYPGETHIDLDTTFQIQTDDINQPIQGPTIINISDLGDAFVGNKLVTGEQWEGVYIKILNANVSDRPNSTSGSSKVPTSCAPPSSSKRRKFTVVDADGNKVVIGDRFLAGRFSAPASANNSPGASGNSEVGLPGGTLMYPDAGASYLSISGIVSHWLNA